MLAKGVSKYHNLSILKMYQSIAMCDLSKHGHGHRNDNSFYWIFDAQPTPLSKICKILVIYHKDLYSPWVYILSDDTSQLSKAPHLYDRKKIRLCLYYPQSDNEWTKRDSLCNTIVAWTYLWLYYYEEWLYSGEWKGGGIHPNPKVNNEIEKKLSPLKKIRGLKNKNNKRTNNSLNYINRIYKKSMSEYIKQKTSYE